MQKLAPTEAGTDFPHIKLTKLCPRGDLSVYDTGRGLAIGALTASVKHRSTFFAQSQP